MNPAMRKALSFLGGMVVVGAAVAALIIASPKVRGELQHQSGQLLDTTREMIEKGQSVVQKLQGLKNALGSSQDQTNGGAPPLSPERAAYEAQWSKTTKA